MQEERKEDEEEKDKQKREEKKEENVEDEDGVKEEKQEENKGEEKEEEEEGVWKRGVWFLCLCCVVAQTVFGALFVFVSLRPLSVRFGFTRLQRSDFVLVVSFGWEGAETPIVLSNTDSAWWTIIHSFIHSFTLGISLILIRSTLNELRQERQQKEKKEGKKRDTKRSENKKEATGKRDVENDLTDIYDKKKKERREIRVWESSWEISEAPW